MFAHLTPRILLACVALLCLCAGKAPGADPGTVIEVAAFGVTPIDARSVGGRAEADAPISMASVRVARGEDWQGLLDRLHPLEPARAGRAPVLPARSILPALKPGRYVRSVGQDAAGAWLLDYLADARTAFRIRIGRDAVEITERLPDDALLRAAHQDDMKNSLFVATDAVGLPERVALQLVEIFSEEVDFLRDLGQGYRCALVYDMRYEEGMAQPGRILAAEISHAGRQVAAYHYRFANGDEGYFKADGSDINRVLRPDSAGIEQVGARRAVIDASASFRRSPLEFSRVTSAPAALRFHPILKQWRAHRGIDYGAPIGTRVKATADGEVYFAGVRGGYGNLVILRHYDRFTTFYGHLNGFASGLSAGDRVRKGEVIGYVGMTGLATGPHLHYELHDDLTPGRLYTPLVVRSIGGSDQAAFDERVRRLRRQLDYAYRANLVMIE